MLLGLRTVIHPAPELEAAKAWWTGVLGFGPYFDEPFYVGFEVGGYELGLNPGATDTVTYWGVEDCGAAVEALVGAGAEVRDPVAEVGGGIEVAAVTIPSGAVVGVIFNPHFKLAADG